MNGERSSMANDSTRSGPPRTRYIRYRVSVVDGQDRPSAPSNVHHDARDSWHHERHLVTETEWRLFAATVSAGLTISAISVSTFWNVVIHR